MGADAPTTQSIGLWQLPTLSPPKTARRQPSPSSNGDNHDSHPRHASRRKCWQHVLKRRHTQGRSTTDGHIKSIYRIWDYNRCSERNTIVITTAFTTAKAYAKTCRDTLTEERRKQLERIDEFFLEKFGEPENYRILATEAFDNVTIEQVVRNTGYRPSEEYPFMVILPWNGGTPEVFWDDRYKRILWREYPRREHPVREEEIRGLVAMILGEE